MDGANAQPSQSQPAERTVKSLSGYQEGTVLADGSVVVGDYDTNGKLVGWHKQAPAPKGGE